VKPFVYCLGPQPYGSGDYIDKWGSFKGKFPDKKSALRALIMAHPFPAVLTGRYQGVFFPGVSIPDAGDEEVVQVWASEPQALANLKAYSKANPKALPDHWPHTGDGTDVGLLEEIHVSQLAAYQIPEIVGLLTDGTSTTASASPAGRMALAFTPSNRSAMQLRFLQGQLAGVSTSIRVKESVEDMRTKLVQFHEGMRIMTAYCNGTQGLETLRIGDRAPAEAPYCIFQARLYLEEEIGLIANMLDVDIRNLGDMDSWLLRKNRWKKLLPLDKCIVVTRICRDEKSYGEKVNAFEAAMLNSANMATLVWVRDGDNVWRFGTDIKFEERVFPAGDDIPELVTALRDSIWRGKWATPDKARDNFRGIGSDSEPKVVNPAKEAEPVPVIWADDIKYATLQGFLDSENYTPELDEYIRKVAADTARVKNREMMPFAMLIQGVIDHMALLSIPPGTDIFDPILNSRYLRLVNDFSHGLTDSRNRKQFDKLTSFSALKPGDRIISWRWRIYKPERWEHDARWSTGQKGEGPFLFVVHHTERDEKRDQNLLYVHEYALSKRWVNGTEPLTKTLATATVSEDEWLPADLPVSLADKLLDDREWKRAHLWAVPILAIWGKLKDLIPATQNSPVPILLKLKAAKEEDEE